MAVDWEVASPEVAEQVDLLSLLIRDTDSSLLAFALYRSVSEREAAVRALKERLPLPVVEFTLSAQQKNPVLLLQNLPAPPRVCVFFYDAEEALPELTGYVNLQREEFAEVPHAVIFWVREHGLRELATHAPDFWSWRSGVFDFRSEQIGMPARAVQTELAEPLYFQDRGDLERRVSLYQGLLREYSQQENLDERFLAGIYGRLASAFYLLGHLQQAEQAARDALEHSHHTGDLTLKADSLFMLGAVAREQLRLEEAENYQQRNLAILEKLGDEVRQALSYQELGMIALERQQFDQAEQWHRKALGIKERYGLEQEEALSYHRLGVIAQMRQQFDEAEQWYRKALQIAERLGLEQMTVSTYHQLGLLAQERQQFDEAEQWYRKALQIAERLGLERNAADQYHQLGLLAQERQQFDEAEQWYRKALQIAERLGLERNAADEHHQLGNIAYLRQQFDGAEQWYRKALEIKDRLRHPPLMVDTLAQIGTLRRKQNRLPEALSWFGRALVIAAEYQMPVAVGGQIFADLARVMNEMGEEEFATAWRQNFKGQEPPLALLREMLRQLNGRAD